MLTQYGELAAGRPASREIERQLTLNWVSAKRRRRRKYFRNSTVGYIYGAVGYPYSAIYAAPEPPVGCSAGREEAVK